jgi:predicted dehydrogenase
MFDLLCWIAGQAPVEVYATGSSMMDPAITEAGDVDTSMLILKFADGALCHIDNSRHTGYGYDERIEVFGSKGLVESRRKPTREVAVYKGNKVIEDGMYAGWFERMEPSFLLAIDAFAAALEGGTRRLSHAARRPARADDRRGGGRVAEEEPAGEDRLLATGLKSRMHQLQNCGNWGVFPDPQDLKTPKHHKSYGRNYVTWISRRDDDDE